LFLLKIHGWFYLLKEDIGQLHHKQVTNQVTKINRDIADLEEYQVCIIRKKNNNNNNIFFSLV
jgi:hypothetical protein